MTVALCCWRKLSEFESLHFFRSLGLSSLGLSSFRLSIFGLSILGVINRREFYLLRPVCRVYTVDGIHFATNTERQKMYKILHFDGLGVGGRQNELIELALTHDFKGVEIDMADLLGRHETMGKDFACQFLLSAKINMGTFTLPVDFGCNDEDYAAFQEKVDTIIDLASTLGCKVCCAKISPTSDDTPFQENFERHRLRLSELADKFAESDIRIGLGLQATLAQTETGEHKFIQNAEEILTLVKTVGNANVGLCLDTFEWQVGSGAMDQISELAIASLTEVRLGDVCDKADPAAIKPADRIVPGEADTSIAVKLLAHLLENKYESAISVATNQATFSGASRDKIVAAISARLDALIAQEELHPVEEVVVEEGEGAEGEKKAADAKDATSESTDSKTDAAADSKTDAAADSKADDKTDDKTKDKTEAATS